MTAVRYILLISLILSGCTSSGDVKETDDSSQLRCVGYCDMTISEKSTAARVQSKVDKAQIDAKKEDDDEGTNDSNSDTPDGLR